MCTSTPISNPPLVTRYDIGSLYPGHLPRLILVPGRNLNVFRKIRGGTATLNTRRYRYRYME